MKWIVKKADLEVYRQKFDGKLAAYAEEAKMIALPLPKYYILVLDEEKLHLIQLDLDFNEKALQTIFLHDITQLQFTGVLNKKLSIRTPNATIKLLIKPMAMGIQEKPTRAAAIAALVGFYSGVPTILINASIFLIFICLITNCSRLFHFPSTSRLYLFNGNRKT